MRGTWWRRAGQLLGVGLAWLALAGWGAEPAKPAKDNKAAGKEFTDELTGVRFPAIVADFGDQQVTPPGEADKTLRLRYRAFAKLTVEVAIYAAPPAAAGLTVEGPLPEPFREQYTAIRDQVLALAKDAAYKEVALAGEERPVVKTAAGPLVAARANFNYEQDGKKASRAVLLFVHNGAYLKFDFQYPREIVKEATPAIARFLRELPWAARTPAASEAEHARIIQAIADFVADPKGRQDRVAVIKAYARDSNDVMVVLDDRILSWTGGKKNYRHADVLLGAYIAGNIKTQFERKKAANDSYAGVLMTLVVYQLLKAAESNYTVPELEEYQKLEDGKKLERQLKLLEALANPPMEVNI